MFGIITATIGTSIAGWLVMDFQIIDPTPSFSMIHWLRTR